MTRTALAFLLSLSVALIAGCGAAASSAGASDCTPVNSFGGPIFACGGGGSSAASTDNDLVSLDDDAATDTEAAPEPEPEAAPEPEPEPEVWVSDDTIETRDAIAFEDGSASLTEESQTTIKQVAEYLDSNPDIAVISIEVAPDGRGKKAKKLAKKRAKAVRKQLTEQGVAGKRVKAKGLKSGDGEVSVKIVKRR